MRLLKLFALAHATAVALECHTEPILPRPQNLVQSESFQNSLSGLTEKLDAAIAGEIKAGWDTRNVSMSIGLLSYNQPDPSVPIWEYHHLASGNVNGTKKVNRDSQYLIGSVSKVITDAILLRSGIDLDAPITSFIPALDNDTSIIHWKNITLRSLAGQLAGIPTNYGFSEYYYLNFYFELLGFPTLPNTSYPPCGVFGLNKGCTKDQYLTGLLHSHPTADPSTRPVYSNVAFALAIYALSSVTNKTYTELLSPLPMHSTFPAPGNDSLAVIPPVPNNWGSSYGDDAPGGGLVSTLSDLSVFFHAILSRDPKLGLSETQIREWLKPHAFTGSPYSFVGMPWEIFRPAPGLVFPDYNATTGEGGHIVTIYQKGGGAYGYRSHVALVEEYGLGLVVLTAGGQNALEIVTSAVLGVVLPAADEAAREEVERQYVGVWEANGDAINATVEVDGVGLKLAGLWRDGSDILEGLRELWDVTVNAFLPSRLNKLFRLYPASVERKAQVEGREVVLEDWRFQWDMEFDTASDLPGERLAGNDCLSWTLGDWMHYGSEPVDRVVFVKDAQTGKVLWLDVPFLRTGMMEKAAV
ncbi:hypothetical protein OQA88_12541 [Cercophora sp. LCS_1]